MVQRGACKPARERERGQEVRAGVGASRCAFDYKSVSVSAVSASAVCDKRARATNIVCVRACCVSGVRRDRMAHEP